MSLTSHIWPTIVCYATAHLNRYIYRLKARGGSQINSPAKKKRKKKRKEQDERVGKGRGPVSKGQMIDFPPEPKVLSLRKQAL